MELIPFSIIYWISYFLSGSGHTALSACPLIAGGILLYFFYLKKYGSPLVPVGIFSMSWIFCIGLSCLKLSALQTVWSFRTWLTFYLIFITFVICFRAGEKKTCRSFLPEWILAVPVSGKHTFPVLVTFTLISVSAFFIESFLLGYVPLFTIDTPHAYSSFHISGLHYFTVLCVLVPSLCVLYLNDAGKDRNFIHVLVCFTVSLLLPILLVSRFQLIFAVLLAFLTLVLLHSSEWKRFLRPGFLLLALACLLCLIALYVFITVERAHSIEYLNGIFEMKDPKTPIFITQPYIYIVNNFENFDCLVRDLGKHTYGLRMAYPVFALTGLKFLKPELVSFPLYLTKEELTTVTMFYDAYYDFGITGCVLFSGLLGFIFRMFFHALHENRRPFYICIYAQLTAYLLLAFFTTWFSNPTTWFYFGICVVAGLIVWYTRKKKEQTSQGF